AYRGRALFDALNDVLARVPDRPTDKDRDLMWYLWCGPRSPLFGKDRIATLEIDLIGDPATHVETKNPYFQLIHDADFCDRILHEFGVRTDRGLIVNGHVPVKIEKGESPLKRSGKAITIDGAFSQAYGDHGYTLVLEPERTLLAKHHHFDSVEAAVRDGVDIIPTVSVLRQWDPPRRVADTERGREIRRASAWLVLLPPRSSMIRCPPSSSRRIGDDSMWSCLERAGADRGRGPGRERSAPLRGLALPGNAGPPPGPGALAPEGALRWRLSNAP